MKPHRRLIRGFTFLARRGLAICAGLMLLLWGLTCRRRIINDPRPALRAAGQPYVYALLHAHQLAAVLINDEPRLAAMVSRSADGDLLIPALRMRRVIPVRGSSRSSRCDKGGREALDRLQELVRAGIPALLAVDGPRGPRGTVHRGVLALAERAQAVVLPVVVIPSRRWILARTWDRMHIPRPFAHLQMVFAAPLQRRSTESEIAWRQRVATTLRDLEACQDPSEHARAQHPSVAA